MKKPKFVPVNWNLKKIATYLQMSLIIAGSTQFSPRVFKYWERYCKAEWMRAIQFSASLLVTQQLLLNMLTQSYMLLSI